MTTEKHDPWALLREAQGWIGYWPLTKPEAGAEILKNRIDAALREARAQEAGAKVEAPVVWETDAFGLDYCKQGDKLLQAVKCANDDRWAWGVRVEGYADTEAEAKSAAIAAARGMK